MRLYVETRIRAETDEVWARTQDPARHRRWDLRFTRIDYRPGAEGEPQRFTYRFLAVSGTGVAAGEARRPDGTRTSALRFASAHPLSLIAHGGGYWRYVPDGDAVRFLTGYDYRPRWGRFGAVVDRLLFRPLMGWATAWSFDRLRLWCERGVPPERALLRGLGEAALRLLAVAAALRAGPWAAVPVALAAALLPALPGTPSARRCLRRPPDRGAAAPSLLTRLERP